MNAHSGAEETPPEAEMLSQRTLETVSGGMNAEAIRLTQRMPVLCPFCGKEKTRAMGCNVADSMVFYRCPGCGRDFFGKIRKVSPFSMETFTHMPPKG